VAGWAVQYSSVPVLVKLTPNIGDILEPGVAAMKAKVHGLSLINTIKSIVGVDLDRFVPYPTVGNKSTNGGYCGPAVKPIALHMLAALARDPRITVPISGIGGIATWRDAAEFIALGCGNVQVCTAAMVYGFRIVQDLCDGLANFMDAHGYADLGTLRGRAIGSVTDWGALDLNHVEKAVIDPARCIGCGRCHAVCEDTSHQAITATRDGQRHFEVKEEDCVGCNLCAAICPVPDTIHMRALAPGETDRRTGRVVSGAYGNWAMHPHNPMRGAG
jgi:dihydropyrimidine dehydrogenase (NAD+) subunit PreA